MKQYRPHCHSRFLPAASAARSPSRARAAAPLRSPSRSMAANSLRGGKNVYGPHCLQSNWFEERLEPVKHQAALEKLHQLPAASAKTWTKTSESYGEQFKEVMDKKGPALESASWLSYMKTDAADMYASTHVKSFQHPGLMVDSSELKLPMTVEQLEKYRETWTKGDADRFQRG
ncbi:unnamed protein product [Durusdinium trenchii]|uniref:Uncharacterized protein n=1 Tax=Durusdinium trenchii TaxID=1381693 RepID=A0ABP0PUE6_9DINO